MQTGFFLGILFLTTIAFVLLIQGFWQPIFWAATLAVLFHGLERRLEGLLGGRRSLSAFLTLLVVIATVLVPAFLLGAAVVEEATGVYQRIQSGEIAFDRLVGWVQQQLPLLNELAARAGIDLADARKSMSGVALSVSGFIGSRAFSIGQNALQFTGLTLIMLYLLFFFLRDWPQLVELIVRVLPIGDDRERELLAKFAEVSRATLKGTLVIGLVQGFLGGVIFWVLGLEAAVFWGMVMALLSLIPVVGPGLVWAPAAVILLIDGSWEKALVMVVFGALVIGLVDNLLRPVLVGRDTKMPDYLILLSTLGGLGLFGATGIVAGPVIAALFLAVWTIFMHEYHDEPLPAILSSEDAVAEDAVAEDAREESMR